MVCLTAGHVHFLADALFNRRELLSVRDHSRMCTASPNREIAGLNCTLFRPVSTGNPEGLNVSAGASALSLAALVLLLGRESLTCSSQ